MVHLEHEYRLLLDTLNVIDAIERLEEQFYNNPNEQGCEQLAKRILTSGIPSYKQVQECADRCDKRSKQVRKKLELLPPEARRPLKHLIDDFHKARIKIEGRISHSDDLVHRQQRIANALLKKDIDAFKKEYESLKQLYKKAAAILADAQHEEKQIDHALNIQGVSRARRKSKGILRSIATVGAIWFSALAFNVGIQFGMQGYLEKKEQEVVVLQQANKNIRNSESHLDHSLKMLTKIHNLFQSKLKQQQYQGTRTDSPECMRKIQEVEAILSQLRVFRQELASLDLAHDKDFDQIRNELLRRVNTTDNLLSVTLNGFFMLTPENKSPDMLERIQDSLDGLMDNIQQGVKNLKRL